MSLWHDDVIKWKYFPHFWPFVWEIHRSPVNSLHKSQWRRALVFSLICAWTHGWVNDCKAGDLRRHRAHYDVTVMDKPKLRYVQSVKWIFVLIEKIWYGENFQNPDKARPGKTRQGDLAPRQDCVFMVASENILSSCTVIQIDTGLTRLYCHWLYTYPGETAFFVSILTLQSVICTNCRHQVRVRL